MSAPAPLGGSRMTEAPNVMEPRRRVDSHMAEMVGGDRIGSVADLESAVGRRPAGWHLKSITVLDDHCAEFLARSSFAILGVQDDDGRQWCVPVGGEPGVVEMIGRDRIRLGVDGRDLEGTPVGASSAGQPAGLIALVPGYRETLRINGRLIRGDLVVEEVFLHCAKCMIRSHLWDEDAPVSTGAVVPSADLDHPEVVAFLARSPFIAVTSTDADGHTDVSPKGDPAGFVLRLGPTTLAVPDRPGNRRTDTFHNLLDHPEIALLALVPGDDRVLRVRGRARITDDPDLRARAEVRGNRPAVMLVIEVTDASLEAASALRASRLWDSASRIAGDELPRASRIWTDHVKLNDDPGLAARLARSALPERLMRAGLAADYKNKLY